MKQILNIMITLLLLTSFGCSEETGILAPSETTMESSRSLSQVNWLSLPKPKDKSIETVFSTTEIIDGSKGGYVDLKADYDGDNIDEVKVNARLTFEKGVFEGVKEITFTIDDQTGSLSCYPSGVFLIPVEYDFVLKGIDLNGIDPDNVQFVYISDNGSLELIPYRSLEINPLDGEIILKDALIPHFSRFGFVK